MKAIILGAGQGIVRRNEEDGIPKCLITDPFGQRVLDWIIDSLKQAGIRKIVFVGGFHVEKVMLNYPDLKYYINPNWDETNMVESLFCAHSELNTPFLVSYSDVVYRPRVVKDLRKSGADIALAVDQGWKDRYTDRMNDLLTEAEKVIVKGGRVSKIGRGIGLREEIWGEFTGLALFNEKGIRALSDSFTKTRGTHTEHFFQKSPNISRMTLSDLLQELINAGAAVEPVSVSGQWAELDAPQDLAQFVFGTKAETLDRLSPMIKKGKIADHLIFTIDEWSKAPSRIIRKIKNSFQSKPIVVRSSAMDEDLWGQSNAGKYCSVLDVESSDELSITSSIARVIESYRKFSSHGTNSGQQILVQSRLENVSVSGVLLTRTLEYRAPYFVINYDDRSARTDTVTSGACENLRSLYIARHASQKPADSACHAGKLMDMAKELEQSVGYDSLDIEFGITHEKTPYILQVRPLTAHKNAQSIDDRDITKEIEDIRKFIDHRMSTKTYYYGKTTILGVMPDWNPAEIIGISPRPLALSLYQFLITDRTWAEAREMIGYQDMTPEPLLLSLGGRPYIDTRLSFNSFLPKGISPEFSEKIINYGIERLRENPEFYDKIEFEIVHTCFIFDTKKRLKLLKDYGFEEEELVDFADALLELTDNIVSGKIVPLTRLNSDLKNLATRRDTILKLETQEDQIPHAVGILLDDGIRYGTRPFSILARYAFIGTDFLKSLVSEEIMGKKEYHDFLNSIPTVATKFVDDLVEVNSGKKQAEKFLAEYGHLRPGTYDILSPSYHERPELYLGLNGIKKETGGAEREFHESLRTREFEFSPGQRNEINKRLKKCGFSITADNLMIFIRQSIQAREKAKFEFTKNLSAALSLMVRFGEANGFTRDDMSFVPIREFLRLSTENWGNSFKKDFRNLISLGRKKHHTAQALCLPELICSPDDVEYFEVFASQPNFITQKRIVADLDVFNHGGLRDRHSISGKIVLIEKADPGFDWIFSRNIKGLITRYGGAASHMAIRAAEFGLPSAIGCGTPIYNRLISAKKVELNCSSKQIRVLH